MIKILITDKLIDYGIELLRSMDDVEPVRKSGLSEAELAEIIGEYDGLIIRSGTKVTPAVLANPGRLKAIVRAGVGVDNIDIAEATRKGILVMNTPGGNTQSAAEHTMALLLALSRNVIPACNSLKRGAWDRKKYMGTQLNGKKLGVIGLGRIGMSVAAIAKGFGMELLGYDPFSTPALAEKIGMKVTDELEKIYSTSDYITVHVPRNELTTNLIGAKEFDMMKATTRVVNCARGGIINEGALYQALSEGKIAGAALDVFGQEPPEDTRFAELENCVVTPHLGASTEEAQIEVASEAVQILVDAIRGGPVRNALNAPPMADGEGPLAAKYEELSNRIGKVLSAITSGRVKKVEIQYRGDVAEMAVEGMTTAFAIGLLQRHFELLLNMVNVRVLAKERGISIYETKNSDAGDLASFITAKVETEKMTHTVTGAVFGGQLLRIIRIDDYKIEIAARNTVLIIFNDDKPGVIGAVGTVLGRHGININTMGVSHQEEAPRAMLAVSLDRQPDESTLTELKALESINALYMCGLD